jgi:hypothetical protein
MIHRDAVAAHAKRRASRIWDKWGPTTLYVLSCIGMAAVIFAICWNWFDIGAKLFLLVMGIFAAERVSLWVVRKRGPRQVTVFGQDRFAPHWWVPPLIVTAALAGASVGTLLESSTARAYVTSLIAPEAPTRLTFSLVLTAVSISIIIHWANQATGRPGFGSKP